MRAHQLIGTMAHETFPGHHLEHAWKEHRLVREQGRAESSIQLINTPEAYISEGLAELGLRFVADEGDWQVAADRAVRPRRPADDRRRRGS